MKKNKTPFIFQRAKGREKIVVAFNPSKEDVSVPFMVNIHGEP